MKSIANFLFRPVLFIGLLVQSQANAAPFTADTSIDIKTGRGSYTLPEPERLGNSSAVISAIGTARDAATSLAADATAEKNKAKQAVNDYNRADTLLTNYIKAKDQYLANDYAPYKQDEDRYLANDSSYRTAVKRHNEAVTANNALAPEKRSQAYVDQLNKNRDELNSWKGKLDDWEKNLDAWWGLLAPKRKTLEQQYADYEKNYNAAMKKLQASQLRLKEILEQLRRCKEYGDSCVVLLKEKYRIDYSGQYKQGYFGSKEYKLNIDDLATRLERLKHLSDVPWDGR